MTPFLPRQLPQSTHPLTKLNRALSMQALLRWSASLLVATVISTSVLAATEMPSGDHHTEVDLTQPIAALDHLTSLDNVEPLTMTLPELQHFTTNNGVPVIFVQTEQLPIVDIEIRFNAGSARDGDKYGLASLTAQMLTKGTDKLDETEYAKASEQLGIELGSGAYKDQFVVSLRSLSDSEHLLPAVDLMSDIITKPRLSAEVLERTKAQQVLGLRQMLQSPAYIGSTVFSQELYGDHPYAHSSYGTVASIPHINVQDLQNFHAQYLVAQNATLSITGDLTLDEAKQMANQVTDNLKTGQVAPPLPTPAAPTTAKHVHINYKSDQTSVMIGQLGYALDPSVENSIKQTEFGIGNEVLAGSGFNSRLMGKVRKELGYTYGIYGNMTAMQTNGPYLIRFSTRNERAKDAIDATLETIDNTLENGITEDEFDLTSNSLINSYPMGFASNSGINNMLGTLNFNHLPDSYLTGYIERVESTDKDAVNHTLNETLKPETFIIVTVGDNTADSQNDDANPNALSDTNQSTTLDADESYADIDAYVQANS